MKTKRRFEPNGKLPKATSNSEWDNNRIYDMARSYERGYARLVGGQTRKNKRIIDDFLKRMQFEGISLVRRINYMRTLQRLDCDLSQLNKKHVDAFLRDISETMPGTRQLLFYCLKKFLLFLGKEKLLEGVKPPVVSGIKVSSSDLITREDLKRLLEACSTVRGRAFIMMLYESGARIGEILNIEIRDLCFDRHGVLVDLEGKTGKRRIRLVESAGYLRRWLKEIDKRFLWPGPDGNEPSKYPATMKFLKKTARLAGIRKKVYPHLFRHSRASELAQKLKESQLRAFMGWGAASDMPRVYIHLSAQDVDKAILDIYETKDSKTDLDENVSLDEIKDFYMFYRKMKALC